MLSPGSPIISPAEIINDDEDLGPRRVSILSTTTAEEEEDDVADDTPGPAGPAESGVKVDTLIEWKQDGKKVYITGTFANYWSKKYKLQETYVHFIKIAQWKMSWGSNASRAQGPGLWCS